MRTKITMEEHTQLQHYFNGYLVPSIFKIEQGRFIASINDMPIIDVEARTVIDDDGVESQLNWYIEIKAIPRFESSTKCTCPPNAPLHTPPCIYYAPSPQEIYKETLRE